MKKEKLAVISLTIAGLLAITFYFVGCGEVEQSPVTPEALSEETSMDQEGRTTLGMTVEDFKGYPAEQKKPKYEAFKAKAEAKGMTVEEYKAYLVEQFEAKAEAMGMTVEEFKAYLTEQRKAKYEAFKAEAEAKGMTVEEYKEYLAEQRKAKEGKK